VPGILHLIDSPYCLWLPVANRTGGTPPALPRLCLLPLYFPALFFLSLHTLYTYHTLKFCSVLTVFASRRVLLVQTFCTQACGEDQ